MKAHFAIAVLVLAASPALAQTPVEEQAAIESACNGLGIGEAYCACIAADAMTTLEPEMREFLMMSFADDADFTARANSGEYGQDKVLALIDYQEHVQSACAQTGE